MTWGDALAALIGKRIGQHRYQIGGSERSWEGSAAMFVASAAAMFLVLLLLPSSSLSPLAAPSGAGQALSAAQGMRLSVQRWLRRSHRTARII